MEGQTRIGGNAPTQTLNTCITQAFQQQQQQQRKLKADRLLKTPLNTRLLCVRPYFFRRTMSTTNLIFRTSLIRSALRRATVAPQVASRQLSSTPAVSKTKVAPGTGFFGTWYKM